MLRLQRIELVGFKSFYERAEIRVGEAGVTAVVGPNGCGKSNISDAVAWVLGEQRARSLRGDRMEDVIFSGTGRRSPMGMAEVTLSLLQDPPPPDNGGPLPGPRELTVQRRLYRSGESQYLLNGRPCRLRDVHDVFLGTGLGPNSYAIIEQGRIGQMLSARPSDRRAIIEEAAGITRFKAKRKVAESRLQAAQKNLARVSDILAEVERQRGSLKRQASKARRYREVKRRLRTVLAAVFSTRTELLFTGQETVAESLAGLSEEGRRLEAAIHELDGQVHGARTELASQERLLEEHRQHQVDGRLEFEKIQQRVERLADQARSIDQRREDLASEQGRVQQERERRSGQVEQAASRLSEANRTAQEVRSKLDADQKSLEELRTQRREEERQIEEVRDQRFEVVGREAHIRNELTGQEGLIDRIGSEVARIRTEEQEASAAALECRERIRLVEDERIRQQAEIDRLQSEHEGLGKEVETERARLREAEDAASEAKSHEERLRHRLETIRELSLERAYGTESVQQFFGKARGEVWAPMGILADFVEVEPDYESVIEDLLHMELQYVVVENLLHAEKALSVVRGAVRGRLDFLVADSKPRAGGRSAAPEGATPVRSLVRFAGGLDSLASLVADAYVVDDLALAWRHAQDHPGCAFVARTGEVVRDGVISWGERSSHGPLSLKREMRDLDQRLEEARRRSAQERETAAALGARLASLEAVERQLAVGRQEAEREALRIEHALREAESEMERVDQRMRIARGELERGEQEQRNLEQSLENTRVELQEVERRRASIDEELRVRLERSEALAERVEAHAQGVAELVSGLAVLDERRESLTDDLEGLRGEVAELESRLEWIVDQLRSSAGQKTETLKAIADGESARETLGRRVEELDGWIRRDTERLDQLRQELQAAESEWDGARQRHDSWKDRKNELEIEKARIASDIQHLASLCFSELGESLETICLDSFETLTPEELAEHEQEHQELRRRIDGMGNVNMMAVEEYEEAERRFEFLTVQRQDLMDSIRDTTQAIDEIDAVCRRQFREAFTEINTRFSESFTELFGGGHGELRLIDEAGEEDAGIEIVAQPPGKKLQNVLLLSGGEKAMAALALVIALFRFKPSPFCVLDEVDAPLDDANVDRFANLIRLMSEGTQFIVITHSKRTMETANQLYGVTMEEPGVSKVVSVRLN